jgi:tRNA-splicing ligase RtcB
MILKHLHRVSDYEWLYPKSGSMLVDGLLIGSEDILATVEEVVLHQITHIASLPGVADRVIALPNVNKGAGFPSGCVAAFDRANGVVVLSGIGRDINCGIRMVTTNLIAQDIEKKSETLIREFYKAIPCGSTGLSRINLSRKDLAEIFVQGARWVIENRGMGKPEELDFIEDGGVVEGGNPEVLSEEVYKREKHHIGTLGNGSHYLELQVVEEVFDIERARAFGLFKNQVVVTFQAGSRSVGEQVYQEYSEIFKKSSKKYDHPVKSPELYYLPSSSDEGKAYIGAVRAAMNYGYANRQAIGHSIHQVFNDVIKDVDTNTMYDLGHHTLTDEVHKVGPSRAHQLVHRNGCCRNFIGHISGIARPYSVSGQPVIIGGSMGSASYVMAGREESLEKTFGTTVHGSGRIVPSDLAREKFSPGDLARDLEAKGIYLKIRDRERISEDAPEAYRDIEEVARTINKSGLSLRVARLRPIGVMRG